MDEMGRIRTIKPEFPESESIGRVSRDARLLLLQLLTVVDDAGRARAHPRYLVGKLYAYDDDAIDLIDGWLTELERENHIIRYEADGSQYIEITNFLKHQKIERPSPSKIPGPADTSGRSHQSLTEASPKDSRSLGDGPGPGPGPVSDSCVASGPTVEEHFDRFWSLYPKREGGDPKKPAFEKFRSAVNQGVDPAVIIGGAVSFAEECERKRTEPRYIPMAKAWLHQARWESYKDAATAQAAQLVLVPVFEGTPQWVAHVKAGHNPHLITDVHDPTTGRRREGWHFKSEWPPDHPEQQAA